MDTFNSNMVLQAYHLEFLTLNVPIHPIDNKSSEVKRKRTNGWQCNLKTTSFANH